MGVEVFVVAVGNHFDYHELGEIASDQQHVFTVQNFFELGADNIKQVIGDKICASKFYSAKKNENRPGLEVTKICSCSSQLNTNFFLLINVKIVGHLTFMSRQNSI